MTDTYFCPTCLTFSSDEECYRETVKPVYGDNDHAVQGEGELRCPYCHDEVQEAEWCMGCEEFKIPADLHHYNGDDYCLPCLAFKLIDDADIYWRAGLINIMQETLGEKFDFDQAFEIVKKQMKEYYQ